VSQRHVAGWTHRAGLPPRRAEIAGTGATHPPWQHHPVIEHDRAERNVDSASIM
jgi:hypothetical protein